MAKSVIINKVSFNGVWIASFPTKKDFVEHNLKSDIFKQWDDDYRAKLFSKVYDKSMVKEHTPDTKPVEPKKPSTKGSK